jgi:hypothetical protein
MHISFLVYFATKDGSICTAIVIMVYASSVDGATAAEKSRV